MRHRILIAVALATAFSWTPSVHAADPIRVGVVIPQSGGSGPNGQAILAAIRIMADLVNQKGGLLGRPLAVIDKDDESTPAVGVSRANELITAGVSVIFEGYNSPVTLAMQPVIARANVLDITLISKADPILSGQGNPYAIRLNSSNAQDAQVIAKLVLERQKAKRIAFMTQNDAYGNGAQSIMEEEMAKLSKDYKIVATEKFPFTQTDFRVALTNVKAANPDAVIAINASQSSGMPALIKQYRQANIGAQFVGTTGVVAASTIKAAGEDANGVLTADIYLADVPPFSKIPENAKFVELFEQSKGEKPDKLPALGALAVQTWARAVERAKSLDRVQVAQAIRGKAFENTIFGKVSYREDGQLLSNFYVYTVKDQKMVVLE